jgi:hypothetical protein
MCFSNSTFVEGLRDEVLACGVVVCSIAAGRDRLSASFNAAQWGSSYLYTAETGRKVGTSMGAGCGFPTAGVGVSVCDERRESLEVLPRRLYEEDVFLTIVALEVVEVVLRIRAGGSKVGGLSLSSVVVCLVQTKLMLMMCNAMQAAI